jgi:hypothetical protein
MLKYGMTMGQLRLGMTMRISAELILTFRRQRAFQLRWGLQEDKSESMTLKRM